MIEEVSRSTSRNKHYLLQDKIPFQRGRSWKCQMSERYQAAVTLSLPHIFLQSKHGTRSRPTWVGQVSTHFTLPLEVGGMGGRNDNKLKNNILQLHTWTSKTTFSIPPCFFSSHWLHFFERQRRGSTIGSWVMFAIHIKILAGKACNINSKIFLAAFKKPYYYISRWVVLLLCFVFRTLGEYWLNLG